MNYRKALKGLKKEFQEIYDIKCDKLGVIEADLNKADEWPDDALSLEAELLEECEELERTIYSIEDVLDNIKYFGVK